MAASFDPYHVWLGIPPSEQPPNFYRLLGIPPFEDNPDVISSAADRQMAHLRSFQTGKHSAASQALLNQVATAKVRLLKPATKAAYDAELRKQSAPAGETPVKGRKQGNSESCEPNPKSQTLNPKQIQITKVPNRTAERARPAEPTMELDFSSVKLASRRPRRKRTSSVAGWLVGIGVPAMIAGSVAVWAITHEAPSNDKVAQATPSESQTAATTASAAPPIVPVAVPTPPSAPAPEKILSLAREDRRTPVPAVPMVEEPERVSAFSPEVPVFVAPDEEAADAPEALVFDDADLPEVTEPEPHAAPEAGEKVEPSTNATRLPIPEEEAQATIRRQLKSMHETDEQQTPRARLKLAHELMEVAAESKDPAEQYVLWQTAAEFAGKAGDALLMLQAIEACERQFDFDGSEAREAAVLDFAEAANTSERIRSLTSIARRAIEQSAVQNQWDSALRMANAVARATQRPQGREFRKQAVELRNTVRTVCEEQQQLAAAEATLRANPADESANQKIGISCCFLADDWERGLPFLAKGTDAELRQLAERDLGFSKAANVDERLQLADAWWSLAETRKGEERDALQLRAAEWYQQCLGESLSGLLRLKVEKRLEEVAAARQRQEQVRGSRNLKAANSSSGALWSDG